MRKLFALIVAKLSKVLDACMTYHLSFLFLTLLQSLNRIQTTTAKQVLLITYNYVLLFTTLIKSGETPVSCILTSW